MPPVRQPPEPPGAAMATRQAAGHQSGSRPNCQMHTQPCGVVQGAADSRPTCEMHTQPCGVVQGVVNLDVPLCPKHCALHRRRGQSNAVTQGGQLILPKPAGNMAAALATPSRERLAGTAVLMLYGTGMTATESITAANAGLQEAGSVASAVEHTTVGSPPEMHNASAGHG